ncbi:hypothetical protein EF918_14530 [Streptomyces sp. WAC06614]|nr:hypothetical protein EF918_14530 [Streptomyces sp. WAC06614]
MQIQAAVHQDSTRLAFGGQEAVCDGEPHKWSATGSLKWTRVHEGPAVAEVRLQSASLGSGFSVRVSYLATAEREVFLKTQH